MPRRRSVFGFRAAVLFACAAAALVARGAAQLPDASCVARPISSGTDLSAAPAPTLTDSRYDAASESVVFTVQTLTYWDGSTTVFRSMMLVLGNGANAACVVGPSVGTFTGTSSTCTASLTMTAPWGSASACGWTNGTEADGVTPFTSSLAITYTDQVASPAATRNQTITRPVVISFPTSINASAGFDVGADSGRGTFFVNQLTYSNTAGVKSLTFDYQMTNPNPYIYTFANATTAVAGVTLQGNPAIVATPQGCDTTGVPVGQSCTQRGTFAFTVQEATCSVAGVYRIAFNTQCGEGCTASSDAFDVNVGTFPVCDDALNTAITGVTAGLTSPTGPVGVGGTVSIPLAINSPQLRLASILISNAFIASTKHAADPAWANRSAVAAGTLTPFGTAISFAASGGFSQTFGTPVATATSTITFNANSAAVDQPNAGLLQTGDIGTGGNAFTLYVRTRLTYDANGATGGARRRLLHRYVDVAAELPDDGMLYRRQPLRLRAEVRPGATREVRAKFEVDTGTPADDPEPAGPAPTSTRTAVPAQTSASAPTAVPAQVQVSSSVPVGAIVGAIIGWVVRRCCMDVIANLGLGDAARSCSRPGSPGCWSGAPSARARRRPRRPPPRRAPRCRKRWPESKACMDC